MNPTEHPDLLTWWLEADATVMRMLGQHVLKFGCYDVIDVLELPRTFQGMVVKWKVQAPPSATNVKSRRLMLGT